MQVLALVQALALVRVQVQALVLVQVQALVQVLVQEGTAQRRSFCTGTLTWIGCRCT